MSRPSSTFVVDTLGLLVCFAFTEGERHDTRSAPGLIARARPRCLLGDKACGSAVLRDQLAAGGAEAVIPPKQNRTRPVAHDRELHKARSKVGCTFHLLNERAARPDPR
ncbi:transposase [Sorangium sp. So ce429]